MNIVIISELSDGGVERVNYLLAKGFKNNNNVTTISVKGIGADRVKDINYINLNKRDGKRAVFSLLKKLVDLKPDWVLCCDYTAVFCALVYRCFKNRDCRVMFTVHSVYSSMFRYNLKRKLILRHYIPLILRLYNRCDAVVYVSEGVKVDFKKLYKINNSIEHTIYNPVFEDKPECKLKDNYKFEKGLKIVSVGRLAEEKRQDIQINAINELKKNGHRVELYIYGSGDKKTELENLAQELNVDSNIHFMGFSNNILNEIKKYDMFWITSDFESFGNVIVEAMGMGIPVISRDCPYGPAEILENGNLGVLYNQDKEKLSDKVEEIINNGYDSSMIKNSYKKACRFTVKNVVNQYLEVMNR